MDFNTEPEAATSLLEKAQLLHDQYVKEAEAHKEKVISEANDKAERLVEDATAEAERLSEESQAEADRLIGEANTERENTLSGLEAERVAINEEIEKLREFEATYRQTIVDTLYGFLHNVQTGKEVEETVETNVEETNE